MQQAVSSRGDAESPSAAVRRKPRSRFRVGYARDAAEEEEADAPSVSASAAHGNDIGRTSSAVVSAGPASEIRHVDSPSDAALDPIRTRINNSTARQEGMASLAALPGESTAVQPTHKPALMHDPVISPAINSATRTSLANQARLEAAGSEQAHSAIDEIAPRQGSAADAMPIAATISGGSASGVEGGASLHTGPLPTAGDIALSPARTTAVALHATNAFDAALGFGDSQLEAASLSMFESGLEGHSLPDKIVRVRQRLELEQDRLASGAVVDVARLLGESGCAPKPDV